MPISVTLHNRTNRRVRSNEITNQFVIVNQSGERDLGPSGSRRHEFSLAGKRLWARETGCRREKPAVGTRHSAFGSQPKQQQIPSAKMRQEVMTAFEEEE